MTRVQALLRKELLDLRANPTVLLPAVLTGLISIALPFFVAVVVPYLTGERLSDSSDFRAAATMYPDQPRPWALDAEGAVQAWIFQQFLILLLLTPIAGSMALAAHSIIGEKQGRTLEPLLATPITTGELLTAKVLGSFIPTLLLTLAYFLFYVALVALFARPGVFAVLLTARSLVVVFVMGPLAALAALQLAVCVSSRVGDTRSAQQIGALIILPVSGLLIAQVTGHLLLTVPVVLAIGLGLAALNAALLLFGIVLFDRESILTRWR
jgi:ABC-2 type transport system permease protein